MIVEEEDVGKESRFPRKLSVLHRLCVVQSQSSLSIGN